MAGIRRKRLLGLCLVLALLVFDQPARAQDAAGEFIITWICRLASERTFTIQCVREQTPPMNPAELRQRPEFDTQQYLRDLFAPAQPRNITHLVRTNPLAYDGRIWRIPLFGPPIDMEDVQLLARSVMCGRDRQCVVKFDGPR